MEIVQNCSPADLNGDFNNILQIVLPSKAICNEKIMDTLMLQANLGTFREREIDRKYLDALENYKRKKPDGRFSSAREG